MDKNSSLRKFIKSFSYAFNGLKVVAKSEQNFRFHIIAAVAAILLAVYLRSSRIEIILIILCAAIVIAVEIINTAIEKLCDSITPCYNEKIKIVKDLGAASVLIVSIASIIIGLIIFLPKICNH